MLTLLVVVAICVALASVCAYGLVKPENLSQKIKSRWQEKSTHAITISVCLIFGLHLIAIDVASRFPVIISILGYLIILIAIAIAATPKQRTAELMNQSIASDSPSIARTSLTVGLGIALFVLAAII